MAMSSVFDFAVVVVAVVWSVPMGRVTITGISFVSHFRCAYIRGGNFIRRTCISGRSHLEFTML